MAETGLFTGLYATAVADFQRPAGAVMRGHYPAAKTATTLVQCAIPRYRRARAFTHHEIIDDATFRGFCNRH
jgi:hypothetical protein